MGEASSCMHDLLITQAPDDMHRTWHLLPQKNMKVLRKNSTLTVHCAQTNWYHAFSPSGQKAASSLMQENCQFSCYRPILGTDLSLWLLASLSINPTIKPRTGELPHQVKALAVCQARQLEFGPQHPESRGEHWLPQVAFWSPYACCSIHTTLPHNQVSVI